MTESVGLIPETILLLEHCEAVSQTVIAALQSANFRVLHAGSGSKAVEMAAAHEGNIDLLLADVNIPGVRGPQIAEAVKLSQPNIRVMFISDTGRFGLLLLTQGWAFINEPFDPENLLQTIKILLHTSEESRAPGKEALAGRGNRSTAAKSKLLTMTANSSARN